LTGHNVYTSENNKLFAVSSLPQWASSKFRLNCEVSNIQNLFQSMCPYNTKMNNIIVLILVKQREKKKFSNKILQKVHINHNKMFVCISSFFTFSKSHSGCTWYNNHDSNSKYNTFKIIKLNFYSKILLNIIKDNFIITFLNFWDKSNHRIISNDFYLVKVI